MKLFQATEIKRLDAYTIEHEPISSIDLMERAATALANAIKAKWDKGYEFKVFAGPGNNGGDALAVSRLLAQEGYTVQAFLFNTSGKLSDDCAINKERLSSCPVEFNEITSAFNPPTLKETDIVVDGLFGTGLNKPLTGGFAAVVKYINASPATVVSIDIPSGLMSEDNSYNTHNTVIRANHTLTFHAPKLAFLFPENQEFIGECTTLDIQLHPEGIKQLKSIYQLTEQAEVAKLIRPRKAYAHKGNFGHGLLIAGSKGMAGAAILAARACLKSGIGLLTVHSPMCNNNILQTAVPEAMVENDLFEECFAEPSDPDKFQTIAIGPGLGKSEDTVRALAEQLSICSSPVVLDADALNIIATNRNILTSIPKGSILTPHPKELDRITGQSSNSYERLNKARDLAAHLHAFIVLKGSYTAIITPDGECLFNPTGNAGMATGGCGDVLTGILLALLAQGYSSKEACLLGVYTHGLAGDIAAGFKGQIGMTASDVVECLPEAWKQLSTI